MEIEIINGFVERVLAKLKVGTEEREDCRQEAFLRMAEKVGVIALAIKGRTEDEARGYIYRVVDSAIRDFLRALRKRQYYEINSIDHRRNLSDATASSFTDAVNYNESLPTDSMPGLEERNPKREIPLEVHMMRARLVDSVRSLPAKQRKVVVGIYLNGESTREIAKKSKKSQFWPREQHRQALENLRASFGINTPYQM
jgi:RNA polymerase sigma factor (sigma-70 family)